MATELGVELALDPVADELADLQQRGVRYVVIVDSIFNSSPEHVQQVCEAILRRNLRLRWACFLRPAGLTAAYELQKRGFDVPEFLGLRAPCARDGVRPVAAPGARTRLSGGLQTGGAYALCRHPIYFFTALFFSAWPSMDEGKLVFAAWISTGPSPTTVRAAWISMPGAKPSAGLPFLSTPWSSRRTPVTLRFCTKASETGVPGQTWTAPLTRPPNGTPEALFEFVPARVDVDEAGKTKLVPGAAKNNVQLFKVVSPEKYSPALRDCLRGLLQSGFPARAPAGGRSSAG